METIIQHVLVDNYVYTGYCPHYDVSPFDLYISSGFASQLSCLVIFSLPFFGNHNLLFNRVNVLLTYTITGFKSAE